MTTVRTVVVPVLAVIVFTSLAAAQSPVGALAIDERQGDQYGWAVDYETAAAAQGRALQECGPGCSVVLTFGRCAAYAAGQDADSTAVGWAESFDSASGARLAALSECSSRGGGSGCTIRVWGCNGPVVEEGLGLNQALRQQIQEGLRADGFDPGGVDGLFGLRTRAAIRSWQSARGARSTGYLDGSQVEALRGRSGSPPPATAGAAAADTRGLEVIFWQSIVNSTNPSDFEAYLRQFPNGVFRALAQNRLVALRQPEDAGPTPAPEPSIEGTGAPSARSSAATALSGSSSAVDNDVRRRPGDVFRDCDACPAMVVMPDGDLALGRYEVTVAEYRAFASETGSVADDGCSWRNPGFPQTDRHPVVCVSWDEARAYASWLSRTTGSTYRLPTETEWERAAEMSQPGCYRERTGNRGTCQVGSYGSNRVGLSDMVGNVYEWTERCSDFGTCRLRGSSWEFDAERQQPGERFWYSAQLRDDGVGFRVSRPLP